MTKHGKPRLPVGQLSVLSLCRLAEPIALTSVFPYLPEMIESFGVEKNDVAQWAGLTSAIFAFGQFLSGIPWGAASDRIGRKPTLLIGLFILMCTTVLFGFSQSLAWAIVVRGIAGASSGIVGISRTTVAEMVPHKELQPRAFSVMPLMWSIGSIIGPMFGGALASPAKSFPDLFGDNPFFNRFPFALPNLIAAVLFFFGVSTGILFLKETLETKKNKRDYGLVVGEILTSPFRRNKAPKKSMADNEEDSPRHSPSQHPQKPKTALRPVRYADVFNPQSTLCLLSYTLLALHSIAFDQLIPVFLHLPVQDPSERQLPFKFAGGFGLDSGRIGAIFTIFAIVSLLFQFLVYPPVCRRYGVLRSYQVMSATIPVTYFLTPFSVLLPTPMTREIAIVVLMCAKCIATVFAFPSSMILLTNSVTSLRMLGTLNGVATSISGIGRASGPALLGRSFTLGVDAGYVIFPWLVLSLFGLLAALSTRYLVESDGPKPDDDLDVEDELSEENAREDQPLLSRQFSNSSGHYDGIS